LSLKSILADDLKFAIDELPASITYLGNVYSVAITDIVRGGKNEAEGFMPEADAVLHVAIADMPSEPIEGKLVGISGKNYRIAKVAITPDENEWIVSLTGDIR